MGGPSRPEVILVSLFISLGVSLGVQWASDTGRLEVFWAGKPPPPAQLPPPAKPPQPRLVPELVGLPRNVASELLQSRNLLLVVREQREDAERPVDVVISQDPLPGSELAESGQVSVVLSLGGGERIVMPDLSGIALDAAKRELAAAGLNVSKIQGAEGGEDRVVMSSTPAAGEKVKKGGEVVLKVELGQIEVPKVVGMSVPKAKAALEKAGLKLGKVKMQFDENRPEWAVLRQAPEAGSKVGKGSQVDLIRNEE